MSATASPAVEFRSLAGLVRDIPDFPKKGIIFKDITPLLAVPQALAESIERLAAPWLDQGITHVVGIESRGFIFAPAVALKLRAGFIPVRKPGKLPYRSRRQEYGLEYGRDVLEIHEDAVDAKARVLVIDDVLATGGTASAAIALVQSLGAQVVGFAALVELGFLGGAKRLTVPTRAVLSY